MGCKYYRSLGSRSDTPSRVRFTFTTHRIIVFFFTEKIAEIANMEHCLPFVFDRDDEYYLCQEGQRLLVGAYERNFRFWTEDKTPLDFCHELYENGLERIDKNILRAIDSVPVIVEASIKCVINDPMLWSSDSNVLSAQSPNLEITFAEMVLSYALANLVE